MKRAINVENSRKEKCNKINGFLRLKMKDVTDQPGRQERFYILSGVITS